MNHHAVGEIRHHNFAVELAKAGHNVTLFAASFQHYVYKETQTYRPGESFKIAHNDYYRNVFVKTPPYYGNGIRRLVNQIVFALRAYLIGRELDQRPDVVVGSSVHLFTGITAYFLARKYNVPFIFEVRDLWPQTLIDLGVLKKNSPAAILFRQIEKFLYRKATKIISVLPKADDYITSLNIPKEKICYIPNGVQLEWFDRNTNNALNDFVETFFRTHQGQHIIVYAGSIGLANGLELVVDTAHLMQQEGIEDVHFLIVGEGPEKERLVEKSRQLRLTNLTFAGQVPKDHIPTILKRSDACLSVVRRSKVHRYGVSMNKLFDYMASEKPMISVLDSTFDFAEVAKCGVAVKNDNSRELINAINTILSLPQEKKHELAQNGRRYVEEYHNYPVLTRRLLDLIHEAIK